MNTFQNFNNNYYTNILDKRYDIISDISESFIQSFSNGEFVMNKISYKRFDIYFKIKPNNNLLNSLSSFEDRIMRSEDIQIDIIYNITDVNTKYLTKEEIFNYICLKKYLFKTEIQLHCCIRYS